MHNFLKPYLLKPIYFTLILSYHKIRVLQGPVFVMTLFNFLLTIWVTVLLNLQVRQSWKEEQT